MEGIVHSLSIYPVVICERYYYTISDPVKIFSSFKFLLIGLKVHFIFQTDLSTYQNVVIFGVESMVGGLTIKCLYETISKIFEQVVLAIMDRTSTSMGMLF